MINFKFKSLMLLAVATLTGGYARAAAKILVPGESIGQLMVLTPEDIKKETPKYKKINPLSIPVFSEMPADLSVVAAVLTSKSLGINSHVFVKCNGRHTPYLDISSLEGGLDNALFSKFKDGDWIRVKFDGRKDAKNPIEITPSNQADAEAFYASRKTEEVKLVADLSVKKIFTTAELGSKDYIRVGSKAANYGELAKALNVPAVPGGDPGRVYVREGFAVPFAYYQEFLDSNPKIKKAIREILEDSLMDNLIDVEYRRENLTNLQNMIKDPKAIVSQQLIDDLLAVYDQQRQKPKKGEVLGKLRKMKMRSSTNSEDLPNFNGAGLYTSESYKPNKNDVEKSREDKEKSLREVLQNVWASVWELRAFDERNYFHIPHDQVKMGMQVNPSFGKENADGVVITKNIAGDDRYPGDGVYIETQRGDVHSVANPIGGSRTQKILVLIDKSKPLDTSKYQVKVLQNSNIDDDGVTVIQDRDNPNSVMEEEEAIELTYLVKKAEAHFKPIFGKDKPDFALDLEFKVDSEETGARRLYLKQSRPYIQ